MFVDLKKPCKEFTSSWQEQAAQPQLSVLRHAQPFNLKSNLCSIMRWVICQFPAAREPCSLTWSLQLQEDIYVIPLFYYVPIGRTTCSPWPPQTGSRYLPESLCGLSVPLLHGCCVCASTFLQCLNHDKFQNGSPALSLLLPLPSSCHLWVSHSCCLLKCTTADCVSGVRVFNPLENMWDNINLKHQCCCSALSDAMSCPFPSTLL